jgi:SAM-dependent methyltransferase
MVSHWKQREFDMVVEGDGATAQAEALPSAEGFRYVLNVGSGPRTNRHLHPIFSGAQWRETRLDVDPAARPDLVGSIVNLGGIVPTGAVDAIWSSHILEHLYHHEVPLALAEYHRVLKSDGFALITSPDLEIVTSLLLQHGLDHVVYNSPMGPITPRDMLFGHSDSISRGHHFMAHNTGFTCASLGDRLVEAGFSLVLAKRDKLDLWALALREDSNKESIQRQLKANGLDMFDT